MMGGSVRVSVRVVLGVSVRVLLGVSVRVV